VGAYHPSPESPKSTPAENSHFAAVLAAKYRERLSVETLMVNELYLSVVYRPIAGRGSNFLSRIISKTSSEVTTRELADALDACEKLAQTIDSSLARYEPERLAVYDKAGRRYSAILEFFNLLLNADPALVPLPAAPLHEALNTHPNHLRQRDHRISLGRAHPVRRHLRDQGVRHADDGRHVQRAGSRRRLSLSSLSRSHS